MKIEILYEDDDILAINKPAGLVVHADGHTKEPSVAEWFVSKYPEAKDVGEPLGDIPRPGIVHRIDRETSGVLLLAKTKEGHACLKEQFQNHEIEKIYHAFIYGEFQEDHGTINLPIGKSASDFRKRSAERGARGELREAVTYYQVMKKTPEVSLVEAKPKTGRTHQIRVHFKALHHPVVADPLYARTKPKLLGFERLALHARQATFTNVKGEKNVVVAPYPNDFQTALDKIGISGI
ncbi:RluA family pseudouridine synthase [Candidatus Parcubacteria bacterium]|nr:RluA family pseudouridine synthase [Candidatus Parcubacteria bacterium]